MAAVLAFAAFAPAASAEDWEQKATIPFGSNDWQVNDAGTVAFSSGNTFYRWTQAGGAVPIGHPDIGCYGSIIGISDEGVILGHQAGCSNDTPLFWTPASANPIKPFANHFLPVDIAPDGRFIGTWRNPETLLPSQNVLVVGQANVNPNDGTLLAASSEAGPGTAIAIARDGTRLTAVYPANTLNPPAFYRDGTASGPDFARSTQTFERVYGLTPDERVLARVYGDSDTGNGAIDIPAMKLGVWDLGTRSDLTLSGGGLTVSPDQAFLPGGGTKLAFATAVGTGVPPGEASIALWNSASGFPHSIPAYFPLDPGGKPTVTSAAVNSGGSYLVLSNGEVWFDKDWEQSIPSQKLTIPESTKRYAFQQQQYYEDQTNYWQLRQQRTAALGAVLVYFNPPAVLGLWAIGLSGQGVEFTATVKNRDYWATVALDPPDPKWKTVASAPKVTIGKLKRPRQLSKADFSRVSAFIAARLRFLAAQICAEDAINRGSTAIDEDAPDKAKAQYRAGQKCSKQAQSAAKEAARLAPKAVPVIDRAMRTAARSLHGRKTKVTARLWKKAVNLQIGQLTKLIALPKDEVAKLRKKLGGSPVKFRPFASSSKRHVAAAKHDGGTAGRIGEVAAAFKAASG